MGLFSKLWPFAKKADLPATTTEGKPSPQETPTPTNSTESPAEDTESRHSVAQQSSSLEATGGEEETQDDEGAMIIRLERHRKFKNLVMERLKAEGIDSKATTGNDPNGDILIVRKKDASRVREIIWGLPGEVPPEAGQSKGSKRVQRRRQQGLTEI